MPIINASLPGAMVRPIPGLSIAEPELQLAPNDRRITAAGLDRASVATIVRAVTSGAFVGEYFDGNDRMDMILKGPVWTSPDELASTPIATPLAGVQTIGELTTIERTVGPTQLLRVDGQRTLTLSVTPPDDMTVQEALGILRDDVGPKIRAVMPDDMGLQYRGTADRLEQAFATMGLNLLTAAIVLFLILAAMFRSLRDAFIVMLSMPLAIAGGVVALRILNLVTIQAMDLLTMIGFLILLGLVVNNAILLVMQTREGINAGTRTRRCGRRCRAHAGTANLPQHADQYFRHVAADGHPGCRFADLPRTGDRDHWRNGRQCHFHIDTHTEHFAASADGVFARSSANGCGGPFDWSAGRCVIRNASCWSC